MPKIPIPATIAQIDAAWLTQALASTHPGLVVTQAKVLESLGGACTKLRVALQTNSADFPRSVIVKGCFEPHSQIMRAGQRGEVMAYRDVVSHLTDIETVRILWSQEDAYTGAAIIMEDLNLRGVRCLRVLEPIDSFELAASFLEQTAKIHARWWAGPEVADGGHFAWVPGPGDPHLAFSFSILENSQAFAEYTTKPRCAATARLLKDPHRLMVAARKAFANPLELPLVMCHGDMHLANLYVTAQGHPGFLDWTLRRAACIKDVTYFIIGCLDVVDRRRWEQALIEHYLTHLKAYGIDGPPFDLAWEGYRQWSLWGMLVWMINLTDFHSESAITAMTTRFGTAMLDNDSFGSLGV